jgi:NAD(P)-dependent dehydrogenase (short-subunit alcohol dehydrogenase family)
MSLAGKQIVVTGGGGRGMGFQLVKMFHDEGAHVIACDISPEALEVVREKFPDIVTVVADIGTAAGCDQLLEAAGAVVDVLCNHAGTSERIGPVDEIDEDEWERVIAVNMTAALPTL